MKLLFSKEPKKPFSDKTLTRALLFVIFILALMAGYYKSALMAENKKYLRLEDRYVRLRSELGIDLTQDLIDRSRKE